MITVRRANSEDAVLVCKIGIESFLLAHGKSAPKADIDSYLSKSYRSEEITNELQNPLNNYHLVTIEDQIAGFSKLKLNTPNANIAMKNIAVLDRLYLSEAFHGKNLGKHLIEFNISFAKSQNQAGLWLAVWIENHKAISFYKRNGFEIVGKYDFQISETHTNPNHIMYLGF
jgi:diamine N-acetyltransferase